MLLPSPAFGSVAALVWLWISTKPHAGYWFSPRSILNLRTPKGDFWGQRWHFPDQEVNSERADSAPLGYCWQQSSWSVTAAITGHLCTEEGSYHTFGVHREEASLLRSSYNTAGNIHTAEIISLELMPHFSWSFLSHLPLWGMHRRDTWITIRVYKTFLSPQ